MFDGNFEIVGHPRGQADGVRMGFQDAQVLRSQAGKGRVGVGVQRRDRHQADQIQVLDSSACAHNWSTAPGVEMSTPPRDSSPSRLT